MIKLLLNLKLLSHISHLLQTSAATSAVMIRVCNHFFGVERKVPSICKDRALLMISTVLFVALTIILLPSRFVTNFTMLSPEDI